MMQSKQGFIKKAREAEPHLAFDFQAQSSRYPSSVQTSAKLSALGKSSSHADIA